MKKLTASIFVLLTSTTLLVSCDSPAPTESNKQQISAPAPEVKRIDVSAKDYFKDYSEKEISADEKYKDKPLRVTGIVKSIDKGLGDDSFVLFAVDEDGISDVRCSLQDKSIGMDLKKGQKITFDGTGDGMLIGDPQLKDCVIAK